MYRQPRTITTMESAHVTPLSHQLERPTVTKSVKTTLRQSSQRQGNCMNCNLGRTFHSNRDTGSMRTEQTTAHTAKAFQSSCLSSRQSLPRPAVRKITTISRTEIQEMIRLKAS